jgi:hypothetical protein
VKRRAAGTLLLVLLTLPATPARADARGDKQACADAYEQGQRLRRDRALLESRVRFVTCSRVCPPALQAECTGWLDEVNRALPTVVLAARLADGSDLVDVHVQLDGRPFVDRLDGKAVELDPGQHTFSFHAAQTEAIEQRIVVREGEKERALTVVLGSTPRVAALSPPPGAPVTRPIPVAVWALLGLGAAGLGMFAGFGLAGRSEQSSTLDACRPACSPTLANGVLEKYRVADVSLGVAAAAVAAATVIFLVRPTHPVPTRGDLDLLHLDF